MASVAAADAHAEELRVERDLYKGLLGLGEEEHLEELTTRALAMVVDLASARFGYLEIVGPTKARTPAFWLAHDPVTPDAIEELQSRISRTVIKEVMHTAKLVATASAQLDPRFSKSGSVKRQRIEAVLCVPIGRDPVLGAIYLQGRERPGAFSDADRQRIEIFASHLARFADRLLTRASTEPDPTLRYRETLVCDGVIGRSQGLAEVLKQLAVVAPHDVSVLINGATGTGKTQLARVLHMSSPRADRAFTEVNCAALPESLVENELFGAVAGAHSTATLPGIGKVAATDGGTLFLDEVGELPLAAQAKLLQFLQSGEYYPLGSPKPRRANIRVIAATNADLEEAISARRFREDLYYRLHVVPVRVPTLAERPEDVPLIAREVCRRASEERKLPSTRLSGAALAALEVEDWPGNVRQLINTVEAGLLRALADDTVEIQVRHLFPDSRTSPDSRTASRGESPTFQEAVAAYKEKLLRATLLDAGGNVSDTARRLDLARSQVNNLIRRFGIDIERVSRPPPSSSRS